MAQYQGLNGPSDDIVTNIQYDTEAVGNRTNGNKLNVQSYYDANQHRAVAHNLQVEGKFREATEAYYHICRAIEVLLNDPTKTLSDTEIERLNRLKQELEDTMFAISTSLGIDPFTGGNEDNNNNNQNEQVEEEATYDQLRRDFRINSFVFITFIENMKCTIYSNSFFQTISLVLVGVFLILLLNDNYECRYTLTTIATLLYVPFGLFGLLTAHQLYKRLKQLNNDYRRLNRRTRTAHDRGTFGYKVEKAGSVVTILKFAWFVFAITSFFYEKDLCENDEVSERIRNIFISLLVVSSLEFWLLLLICACCPLLVCILGCLIYRVYSNMQKTKPVGMNDEVLNRLESKSFHEGMFEEDHDTCIICLCDFEETDRLRILPCSGKHPFHKECIDKWLTKNDTCPQCRDHLLDIVDKK